MNDKTMRQLDTADFCFLAALIVVSVFITLLIVDGWRIADKERMQDAVKRMDGLEDAQKADIGRLIAGCTCQQINAEAHGEVK